MMNDFNTVQFVAMLAGVVIGVVVGALLGVRSAIRGFDKKHFTKKE